VFISRTKTTYITGRSRPLTERLSLNQWVLNGENYMKLSLIFTYHLPTSERSAEG